MSKITLELLDDNYCPLTSKDCEDMSDSFSYSQAILVVKDNNLNKYKALDLSNLTKGTYYIKLNINNEIINRKIILK